MRLIVEKLETFKSYSKKIKKTSACGARHVHRRDMQNTEICISRDIKIRRRLRRRNICTVDTGRRAFGASIVAFADEICTDGPSVRRSYYICTVDTGKRAFGPSIVTFGDEICTDGPSARRS